MTSKDLAQNGDLLIYTKQGIVTLQELLQKEQGRAVAWEEAEKYVRKMQFIKNIRKFSYENKRLS